VRDQEFCGNAAEEMFLRKICLENLGRYELRKVVACILRLCEGCCSKLRVYNAPSRKSSSR
jgi:hypothetical protein